MEKEVKLGDVGELDIKLEGGKITLSLHADIEKAGVQAGVSITANSAVLIDLIKKAVNVKLPNTSIDDAIFDGLKLILSKV